jgi:kumamolisin
MKSYIKRPSASAISSWTIPQLCAAYNWPVGTAVGGATIAIVELGGGWNSADVATAFTTMNLPHPIITDVSVDGTTNTPGSDADMEVALDIQVAAAAYSIATGAAAKVRMYWAQDIALAVEHATKDGCSVCSISWGAPEVQWGKAAVDEMNRVAVAAVHSGMTVFAASGDNDSDDGASAPSVDCPACCPQVIGCGGTSKPKSGVETVWNNNPGHTNGEGTGGGYSTFFPNQPWQKNAPKAPTGLGRMVPDVAANADPQTGYEIVLNGSTQVVGGTSAVAPLYAGLVAATYGSKPGWITPGFYQNPGKFNDITQGNNGTYAARVGPDPCTGMGSPKANLL